MALSAVSLESRLVFPSTLSRVSSVLAPVFAGLLSIPQRSLCRLICFSIVMI